MIVQILFLSFQPWFYLVSPDRTGIAFQVIQFLIGVLIIVMGLLL